MINLESLPSSAEVGDLTGIRVGRTFVAANGQPMQTHGEVVLACNGGDDGNSIASFAVAEVSRPLQSVSRICDQGYEVLFTGKEAKIRDPRTGKFVARFDRRGGLYVRDVKIRAGAAPATGTVTSERRPAGFRRQGRR